MNSDKILAETFAAHEGLAPDAVDVLDDIRRKIYAPPHRQHRRVLTAIGAAIAVLAIAASTTILAGNVHHRTSITPAPTEHTTTLDDRIGRIGTPIGGRFVDGQHGFVLLMRCPYTTLNRFEVLDPRFQKPCVDVLLSSSNGGATFTEHSLPPMTPTLAYETRLYVFDATHVAVGQGAATITNNDGRQHDVSEIRWASSDGGQNWRHADTQPGPPVSAITDDAQFIGFDRLDGVAQVLTRDGVMHPLVETESIQARPDATAWLVSAAGGTYFVYGGPSAEQPVANAGLRVSHDAGRTWQGVRMPSGLYYPTVIGYDGHWLYAMAERGDDGGGDAMVASNDGGRTWAAVSQPKSNGQHSLNVGVVPAGGLLLNDGSRIWRATGTGPFRPAAISATIRDLHGLGPLVIADRVDHAGRITLVTSTDGLRWSTATIR